MLKSRIGLVLFICVCFTGCGQKTLEERAAAGEAAAQFKLGKMYATGDGLTENDAEAVSWYRKAAEQGHVDGQNSLAVMYSRGEGVPRSSTLA